jgi:predicted transglutaminase-like cysteine proteinase
MITLNDNTNLLYVILIAFCIASCTSYHYEGLKAMREAYNSIQYMSDMEQYGISDKWVYTCPEYGDCEDYVHCMNSKLMFNGEVIVCRMYDDYHAILYYNNKYYDPTFNKVYKSNPCE